MQENHGNLNILNLVLNLLNHYDFDTCWCLKRVPIDIKCLYSRDICVWSESFETDGTSLVKKKFCLTIEHIT